MNLLEKYSINATFNISYISLFDVRNDSRMNIFYERGNDANEATPRDLLEISIGLVTRLSVKRFKETFNGLLQDTWVKVDFKNILNNEENVLINIIYVQERLVGGHLEITNRLK